MRFPWKKTYERIEESLVAKSEAAAAGVPTTIIRFPQAEGHAQAEPTVAEELDAAREELLGRRTVHTERVATAQPASFEHVPAVGAEPDWQPASEREYEQKPASANAKPAAPERKQTQKQPTVEWRVQDEEYELVIPKTGATAQKPALVINSEDDVLDELERINGVLLRIRQQLKRSYLPGIPDQLKYYFEQSVHNLGQITLTMERYKYSLEEVTVLLNEANELLAETELLAERTISTSQSAEGAIQYTNRYRRQNRQVNELLTKAEQAFRQLEFSEALRLAEEARLIVEGGEPQTPESRWLLRKKKKGLGNDTR